MLHFFYLKSISAVIEACDEIQNSTGFKLFLEMVLFVGNYMGSSSKTHKDAFAFEMSVLTKVSEMKNIIPVLDCHFHIHFHFIILFFKLLNY